MADGEAVSLNTTGACLRDVEETIQEVIMDEIDFVKIEVASMSATEDAWYEVPLSRCKQKLEVRTTQDHFFGCTQRKRDHLGISLDRRRRGGVTGAAGTGLLRTTPERAPPHDGPCGKHCCQRTHER
jgi:hypothetical protein